MKFLIPIFLLSAISCSSLSPHQIVADSIATKYLESIYDLLGGKTEKNVIMFGPSYELLRKCVAHYITNDNYDNALIFVDDIPNLLKAYHEPDSDYGKFALDFEKYLSNC